MNIKNYYVVLLAGGIGSRFWPVSRQKKPKQFLDILGTGFTLLQATYKRFAAIFPLENIYIITHESYVDNVKEDLPELSDDHIFREYARKNSAPAAAYAANKLYKINPDANILLSPVDHLIIDERAFERQVYEALNFSEANDAMVVLGIRPTLPNTNYSYVQYYQEEEDLPVYKVKTVTEKPNLDLARTFLKSGDFLWNSGISAWKAKVMIDAVNEFLPEMAEVFQQAEKILNTEEEAKVMELLYPQLTNIPLRYGILDRARNIFVLPCYFGWSDLGSWQSAYDALEKDYLGNATSKNAHVMIIDAANCMITAPKGKLVVLQGLEQSVVVDTPDVLLICDRNKEKQLKNYIAEIRRNKGEKYL